MTCVTRAFLLATYFVGNFLTFLKQQWFSPLPITTGATVSLYRYCRLTFSSPWNSFHSCKSPLSNSMSCLMEAHSHQHYKCSQVCKPSTILSNCSSLHSPTVNESTLLHSPGIVLHTTLYCCLKLSIQPIEALEFVWLFL